MASDKDQEYCFYKAVHPFAKSNESSDFEKEYRQILNKSYHVLESNISKLDVSSQKLGDRRRCCVCQIEKPSSEFRSLAHVFPESCGNKIYLSSEECDKCNQDLGDRLENHLAKMLEPIRAIFQIPGKSGSVKIKNKHGDRNIERCSKSRTIFIKKFREDDPLKVSIDEGLNKISIEIHQPAYRPVNAIKAILHSFWLFISNEQRQNFKFILDIINNEINVFPFFYMFGTIPDRDPCRVQLIGHQRRSESSDLPLLVLEMFFGNRYILWGSPNLLNKSYEGFPIPPIKCRRTAPPPDLVGFSVKEDNFQAKSGPVLYTMTSEKVANFDLGSKSELLSDDSLNNKYKYIFDLTIFSGRDVVCIEMLHAQVKNIKSSDPVMIISSRDSVLKFIISGLQLEQPQWKMTFSCSLDPKDIGPVLEATKFAKYLHCKDSRLQIKIHNGDVFILAVIDADGSSDDYNYQINMLEKLALIEEKCRVRFKVKFGDSLEDDADNINYAYNVLAGIYDDSEKVTVNFCLRPELSSVILAELKIGSELSIRKQDHIIEILGQKVSLPPYGLKTIVSKCQLVRKDGKLIFEGEGAGYAFKSIAV